MTVRVLLVDDHRLVLDGLRALLQDAPDIDIAGVAGDGAEAVRLAGKLQPHVIVMDTGMPGLNGIEATRRILHQNPDIRVIGISVDTDQLHVMGMFEAGAWGYLPKTSSGEELLEAIRIVSDGRKFISPAVSDVLIANSVAPRDPVPANGASLALGSREREVLQLLAEGLSSKEMGFRLGISAKTVETHRRNIMRKLDMHTVAHLTKFAIREGLTQLDV